MKKYILLTTSFFCISLALFSQPLKKTEDPVVVLKAVENRYPNLACKWEKEEDRYEANCKQNGRVISVVVSSNGVVQETETGIDINGLPAAAIAYMKQHYPGKNIREATKIEDNNGVITYEASIKGKDVIFDDKGVFLKEVTD